VNRAPALQDIDHEWAVGRHGPVVGVAAVDVVEPDQDPAAASNCQSTRGATAWMAKHE
jgi:hypothetical protein